MVAIGDGPEAMLMGASPVAPPTTTLPAEGEPPRWIAVVGRLDGRPGSLMLRIPRVALRVERRCDAGEPITAGTVGLVGIATAHPARIVVPCGGILPAPTLVRARDIGALDGPPGPATLAGLAGRGGSERNAPPLAPVTMLGVAALALIGGAIGARRFGGDDPEPEGGDDARDEGADEDPSPPTLTLVPMPRERAP
jgi:hypothetical protein